MESQNSQLEYFLTLPDDVLLHEIFPELSVPYFLSLCELQKQFSNICGDNDLWHYYTKRDFGINPVPQGLNNWRDIYMFYYKLLTNPIAAIPYVEDILLRKRAGGNLSIFDQTLISKYNIAIERNSSMPIGGGPSLIGYEHKLALYNPSTNTFLQQTSLDQIRVLSPNDDAWKNISQRALNRQRSQMASYQQSLNALPQGFF